MYLQIRSQRMHDKMEADINQGQSKIFLSDSESIIIVHDNDIAVANVKRYAGYSCWWRPAKRSLMMKSSIWNIFRVTGHLCGEVPGEFPAQRPATRSFDVFFDLRLNKRLSKQLWGWWFETPSRPLWRYRNVLNQNCRSLEKLADAFVKLVYVWTGVVPGQNMASVYILMHYNVVLK